MEIVKKVMKEQGLTLGKASKFVKDNNLYQKIGLGGNIIDNIKKSYNKNVKNTKLGSDIRNKARQGLSYGYDKGIDLLENNKYNKYTKPIAKIGRNQKNKVLDKGIKLSGLGMEGSGKGKKTVNRLKKAKRWTDYSVDTINKGMDLGQKGLDMYNKQKDRQMEKAKEGLMKLFGKGAEEEMEGGVNRLKKAKRWTNYSVDTINKGMDLGQRGLDMYNKQKDRQIDKAKDGLMKLFGKGAEKVKRPPSKWILYVKKYAADNNISYKDALKEAGASYKNSK
jgi:hypothetical protein